MTPKEIPSGPGAEFLFEFFSTDLTSLGLMGLQSNGIKSSDPGDVGR